MALNANKANIHRFIGESKLYDDVCQSKSSLIHSKIQQQTCTVEVLRKIKEDDFILFTSEHRSGFSVGRISKLHGDIVHIRQFKRKDELPDNVSFLNKDGETIRIGHKEVVESPIDEIEGARNLIIGKCSVIPASADDSVHIALQNNQRITEFQMYVCRYRLVRKTVYELLPITWANEIELSDDDDSEIDEQTNFDSQTSGIESNLHGLSLGTANEDPKLVSPIKIVNNAVQKVKRQQQVASLSVERKRRDGSSDVALSNDDDSDDFDENTKSSPNKKAKYVDEPNSNYLLSTPVSKHKLNRRGARASIVKKNLNDSFCEPADADLNDSLGNDQNYSVVQKQQDEGKVVMKLKRVTTRASTPLQEINFNDNHQISVKETKNELLDRISQNIRRKSILKTTSSTRDPDTPKRNVSYALEDNRSNDVTQTPTTRTRRSIREASLNASEKIHVNFEESSPEINQKPVTPRSLRTPSSRIKKIENNFSTPKSTGKRSSAYKTPTKGELTPTITRRLFRSGTLTPSMQPRGMAINGEQSELETIRERLHVSAVPKSLPCREKEFENIYSFVKGKINDECGGCIYISGVPGTGKTATVTQVVSILKAETKRNKLLKFDYIEINGMRLTEPRQAYVQMYRQLTGKTLAWAQARDLLEKRFTESNKKQPITILLLDELDIICNRKQDVVYNLFDWTAKKGSKLVAITIANTMDLPERVLKLKVASRLGLTRVTFQPYSFKQLHEVVMARLGETDRFVSEAVQLIARKVASVSGDCRRALDICRRATEIAEIQSKSKQNNVKVSFEHVQQALNEMFASPKVRAIKSCTTMEKLFLRAVATEITRTGIEEVDFSSVYVQLETLAPVLDIKNPPNICQALQICTRLGACRLLIVEDSIKDIFQKIILNVSVDDLYYALNS